MFKIVGAVLLIGGVLSAVRTALSHRKLSQPPRTTDNDNEASLEPQRQGLGFLGLKQNWPAIALMVAGAALLLYAE
ncbi:MAG: hypothetical protein ACRECY_16205 [Phyllobacterium sp.]